MLRSLLIGILLSVIAVLALPRGPAIAQTGFDRPGGDYTRFQLRSGDPAACSARCDREARCRAWSFSYPRTAGESAMCWLKSQVPARVDNTCCVSGVRGAGVVEPRTGAAEFSTDRLGGDYRNFEVPADAKGEPCASACQADGKCRSWTYVRPGYQGAAGRCYLKETVKPPRRKPCCISGVVR
jgi:hypothetical protein